jgi:hypothetical protein
MQMIFRMLAVVRILKDSVGNDHRVSSDGPRSHRYCSAVSSTLLRTKSWPRPIQYRQPRARARPACAETPPHAQRPDMLHGRHRRCRRSPRRRALAPRGERRSSMASSATSIVCSRYGASSIFSAVVDAAVAARSTCRGIAETHSRSGASAPGINTLNETLIEGLVHTNTPSAIASMSTSTR